MKLKLSIVYIVSCVLLPVFLLAADGIYSHFQDILDLQMPDPSLERNTVFQISAKQDNYLRQTRSDTLMQALNSQTASLFCRFALPYSVSEFSYRFINNRYCSENAAAAISLAPAPEYHRASLRFEAEMNDWQIRPYYVYRYSHGTDLLRINIFPESSQDIENDYFYHLLPQTIGDSIPYVFTNRSLQAGFYISHQLPDGAVFLDFKHNYGKWILTESHVNSSEYVKLIGPRESKMSVEYLRWSLKLGGRKNGARAGLGLHMDVLPINWEQTIFPMRSDSTALDMINLTDGRIEESGAQVFYEFNGEREHVLISSFGGQFSADVVLTTPVLGYALFTLPIAHRFTCDAKGVYVGFIMSGSKEWRWNRLGIIPSLDLTYLYAAASANISGQLQFGLSDIDYKEDILVHIILGNIGFDIDYDLSSSLKLTVTAHQLIPYVHIISPEITPMPEDIKSYGGLTLKMKLAYIL